MDLARNPRRAQWPRSKQAGKSKTDPQGCPYNQVMAETRSSGFDEQVRGKIFERYIATWYVTTSEEAARRHLRWDYIRWEQVEIGRGLEIIQNDPDFALWSDERITRRVEDLPFGGSLPPDALRLLRLACAADYAVVEGGLIALARVERVIRAEALSLGGAGQWCEQMDVIWTDGSTGRLFACSRGIFEGYEYYVSRSLEGLRRAVGG
jgi:hypothetical protein